MVNYLVASVAAGNLRLCWCLIYRSSLRVSPSGGTELVQNAFSSALLRLRGDPIENIARACVDLCHDAQRNRRSEKRCSKNSGCAGKRVRRAARRHESTAATAASHAERTTFRALQQHDANQGKNHHKVDNNQYRFHLKTSPSCGCQGPIGRSSPVRLEHLSLVGDLLHEAG